MMCCTALPGGMDASKIPQKVAHASITLLREMHVSLQVLTLTWMVMSKDTRSPIHILIDPPNLVHWASHTICEILAGGFDMESLWDWTILIIALKFSLCLDDLCIKTIHSRPESVFLYFPE